MIKPMGLPPLMVVTFDLLPGFFGAFDVMYERDFLRPLFKLSPELRSIKRYQTYDLQNGRDAAGPFWTFYELDSEITLNATDEIFAKPEFANHLAIFRTFKDTALFDFKRVNYEPIYNFTRRSGSIAGNGPAGGFRWIEKFDLAPERRDRFLEWYLGQYQEEIQECTPDYASYHIFQVFGSTPGSVLSVFQAALPDDIAQSLELLRGKKLGLNSPQWQSYCEDGTVVNLECTALSSFLTLP